MNYTTEIINVCEKLSLPYSIIDSEQTAINKSHIERIYAQRGIYPLWQRLHSYYSHYDPEGWKYISHFIKTKTIIILFDDDSKSIRLAGTHVELVLSETTSFVFYIIDDNLDFLIGFNDHNILIGCGSAKSWVEGINDKLS